MTKLQRAVGQEPGDGSGWQRADEAFRLYRRALKEICKLSSNHSQRADGMNNLVQPQRFLVSTTYATFMRLWIKAHAPDEILLYMKMSDLPSLRKLRELIELPRKEAQTLFAAGKQLRQVAGDLYQMLVKQTPPHRFNTTQI